MGFFKNKILFRKKRFSPNSIPNLGLWLESDYGITKDGSNAVSEWVDRSVNGYTPSQATGANQSIWTANEFGSQAGLIFDGSNDSLERSISNPFGSVQNYSVFVVAKATTGTTNQNWISMGDLGSLRSFIIAKGDQTNRSNRPFTGTVQEPGTQQDVVQGSTALNDNIGHLITYESTGTAWAIRLDGVGETINIEVGDNNGEAPGDFTTLDNLTIGMIRRSNTVFNISNFGAILFYERQLSVAERTKVENYLINKYAI